MKKFLLSFFLIIIILNLIFLANLQHAKAIDLPGLDETAEGTGHKAISDQLGDTPGQIIGKFIQIFLSFLGVIFLFLMIYGGYIWMIARGNEQEVNKAQNIIRNAIIGLVVVLAAYAVTLYVSSFVNPGQSCNPPCDLVMDEHDEWICNCP